MEPGQPSRTALGAAKHRAVHQILEQGRIFSDPLAVAILGPDADGAVQEAESDPNRRRLRLFVAARARFAEEALRAAAARGVHQLVVLGAGLDTTAYRNPLGQALHIFEVDHPATQAWKRERLAAAAIPEPPELAFVPVDFECQDLATGLAGSGFDPARPAFFSWLGVVPYLTEAAVFATLAFIAALPGGAQVVFDYGNPPSAAADAYTTAQADLARRVASAGESFRSHFETEAMHAKLGALGFGTLVDLGPAALRGRFFGGKGSGPDRGGHVLLASTLA